jgi:integrase
MTIERFVRTTIVVSQESVTVPCNVEGEDQPILQEELEAGERWLETGLVFTSREGGPLEPITLHRDFKQMLVDAKISATRLHDLRHSTASLLLAQGTHLRVIMELLGHSSISQTANTYAHVMPAAMGEVADKMESIFRLG